MTEGSWAEPPPPPRRLAGAGGIAGFSRRQFLGASVAGAAGLAAGGRMAWSALIADHVEDATAAPGTTDPTTGAPGEGQISTGVESAPPTEAPTTTLPPVENRVLVVVQLAGGNDGLNTLVPHDGRYMDARPALRVSEGDLVALTGESRYGLHPALRDLVPMWEAKRLAAVEGIGFPDQSRSHFAASDTWWRATVDRQVRTGWLGRWLDDHDEPNPLRAIALGGGSPALVGARSLSTVVLDPKAFSLRTPKGANAKAITEAFRATAAPLDAEPARAAAQQAVPATIAAVETLARAKAMGAGDDDSGPVGRIASLLSTAAGIIEMDLGTRILLVSADGFDTHTDQGKRHAPLLADLAGGIRRFTDGLDEAHRDRVLVITTSEFGRRVKENGSGTDHGDGSVQFLAGAGVAGGQVVGDADLSKLANGDLRTSIDTRALYAAALDWIGGDRAVTDTVLGGAHDRHGLLTV